MASLSFTAREMKSDVSSQIPFLSIKAVKLSPCKALILLFRTRCYLLRFPLKLASIKLSENLLRWEKERKGNSGLQVTQEENMAKEQAFKERTEWSILVITS